MLAKLNRRSKKAKRFYKYNLTFTDNEQSEDEWSFQFQFSDEGD